MAGSLQSKNLVDGWNNVCETWRQLEEHLNLHLTDQFQDFQRKIFEPAPGDSAELAKTKHKVLSDIERDSAAAKKIMRMSEGVKLEVERSSYKKGLSSLSDIDRKNCCIHIIFKKKYKIKYQYGIDVPSTERWSMRHPYSYKWEFRAGSLDLLLDAIEMKSLPSSFYGKKNHIEDDGPRSLGLLNLKGPGETLSTGKVQKDGCDWILELPRFSSDDLDGYQYKLFHDLEDARYYEVFYTSAVARGSPIPSFWAWSNRIIRASEGMNWKSKYFAYKAVAYVLILIFKGWTFSASL